MYRYMMVASACMVCLAHGSNDVANSISPLLVVLRCYDISSAWAYKLGGSGIALGLLFLGQRVIETVGKNVIKLDFYKGFAAQLSTSTSIIIGSGMGLPLSTTHCMIGSLVGIVVAGKFTCIKTIYKRLQTVQEELEKSRLPAVALTEIQVTEANNF